MPLNDRRRWHIEDPAPGIDLDQIEPISRRARALLCRSGSPALHRAFVSLWGVGSILAGIDYHAARFMEGLATVDQDSKPDFLVLRNEAVAWVNRVGQLCYFARSVLTAESERTTLTPTIDSVMLFRRKHTAHRSIDAPHREDTEHLQISHAIAFSELSGSLWIPRAGQPSQTTEKYPLGTHYLAFQMQDAAKVHQRLVVERDHRSVMEEGYKVLLLALAGDA
jgi:hypothetical protein